MHSTSALVHVRLDHAAAAPRFVRLAHLSVKLWHYKGIHSTGRHAVLDNVSHHGLTLSRVGWIVGNGHVVFWIEINFVRLYCIVNVDTNCHLGSQFSSYFAWLFEFALNIASPLPLLQYNNKN